MLRSLGAPWTSTPSSRPVARVSVPFVAQLVSGSVAVVFQRETTTEASRLPSGANEIRTSPVRRQGIRARPLFHSRESRLSSKVTNVVPSSFSRA